MMKIQRMRAAQRLNNIAGVINGIGVHQGTGRGYASANPMKPKRTNKVLNPMVPVSGRRRGLGKPYNQE